MIAGAVVYLFFGWLVLEGNYFLRWVAAVTLWQTLTPAGECSIDALSLTVSFIVAEAGYYCMENIRI